MAITFYTQPQFDTRLTTLSWPLAQNQGQIIQRGFMYWDSSVGYPTGYSQAAVVRFLFNPSTITGTYSIQDSAAQAALNYPTAANNAALFVQLQQQITFSVLFDRTYDLWSAPNAVTDQFTDVEVIGVDVDVRAVRQFTGMYATDYTVQGSSNLVPANTATGVAGSLTQGLMQLVPSYLYFATPTSGLMYYGYIDSWDVTYTHFTSGMIPMRCQVDVSFTLLPPPATPGNTAGSALIALEQQGQTVTINQAALNSAANQTIVNTVGAGAPVAGVGGR
jgi:hypothetical protein